jgi:hypothetical protein
VPADHHCPVAVDLGQLHVTVHLLQQAVMGNFLNRPFERIIISDEQVVNKVNRRGLSVMRDI